jgi:hypothetical protein
MARRCRLGFALVASGALSVALLGCSETLSLAQLPDLSRLPEKLLSKEEQTKTMNDMLEKGQSHQAEAAKAIETGSTGKAASAGAGTGAAAATAGPAASQAPEKAQ